MLKDEIFLFRQNLALSGKLDKAVNKREGVNDGEDGVVREGIWLK